MVSDSKNCNNFTLKLKSNEMLSQHVLMKLIPMETNLAKQNLLSPWENKVLQILKKGTIFNPIKDGLFRRCSRIGGKMDPLKSVPHILQWWNWEQLYLT